VDMGADDGGAGIADCWGHSGRRCRVACSSESRLDPDPPVTGEMADRRTRG
jgi:hypothetical protein